jgi:DNA-binding NarL/FixJ family response regulator
MTVPRRLTRLVVVDPRTLDRELLARALDATAGIEVVHAAASLGDVGDEVDLDAVLIRATTPGFDVLGEIARTTRCGGEPRVVVVTGYVDAYIADRLRTAGVAAIATPDLPLAEVVALVLASDAVPDAPPPHDRRQIGARHGLTNRELEVLDHLADGIPPGQIAHLLQVRVTTVRDHIKSLRAKLGCSSATQLVVTAHRLGLAPHVSRPLL